jgi:hypothetical protein
LCVCGGGGGAASFNPWQRVSPQLAGKAFHLHDGFRLDEALTVAQLEFHVGNGAGMSTITVQDQELYLAFTSAAMRGFEERMPMQATLSVSGVMEILQVRCYDGEALAVVCRCVMLCATSCCRVPFARRCWHWRQTLRQPSLCM